MTPNCPWCDGWDPRDDKNRGASHHICATCQARLLAQLAAKRAA